MAKNRKSYGEGCIAAHALDLIGDRWALLVVRELMLGPRRFGAIRARLPGIASNILTTRLEQLEAAGVLSRRTHPEPAYELTPHGLALGPVLRELCRWGAASPGHDHTLPISPTALMLSMQATVLPGGDFTAGFDMDGESFAQTATVQGLSTRRTDSPEGEMIFAGLPNDMASAIYGPRPLAESAASGLIRFTGDPGRGQDFVDLFHLRRPTEGADT
ncbi:helix-turn-helix transcriptional regulator [Paracoccus sp. Z118]|uniref:winged helix-turn-helix transcriptional regulator n=1 Tax=Paracoccus sp. Z118 TaxID=2851017 RepID=UPI001C2CBAD1|nr:helix-turn-helix domain-containing protein [Paracoccus sp. Z118]MBV0891877.1 helix-turn-helix transcriptional regulator [Paracoccus sp. Z118]